MAMRTPVLIVDDDRAIREMLRVALEVEGYTVRVLTNGRDVIETLRGMGEPCVLLMDLMMPGVSGWDVCEALLADARLARHPVVVMTAGLMKGDSAPAPARTLLCKPFELDRGLCAWWSRSRRRPRWLRMSRSMSWQFQSHRRGKRVAMRITVFPPIAVVPSLVSSSGGSQHAPSTVPFDSYRRRDLVLPAGLRRPTTSICWRRDGKQ